MAALVGVGDSGGRRRLAAVVDRFGEAIEADFARWYPQERLTVLWRKRRWRYLLNLIDHLPRDSYFVEALLDDEEFGEQMASMPASEPRERVSEWGPTRAGLAQVEDAVRALHATVQSALGGKPQFEPAIRPSTAVDRARKGAVQRQHRRNVQRFLGVVPDLDESVT